MKKTYITHVTKDYLGVALNLAKSIRSFSDLPLVVYCIDLGEESTSNLEGIENVFVRRINLNLEESTSEDYLSTNSGNFYVNRSSSRIFSILSSKTIAMEMALDEGWE